MTSTVATAPTTGPIRAAIYTRISRDDQGDLLGVRRQERAARELCRRKGWEVAAVYVDDDISAWSGKRRPAYQELLEAVSAGSVDAVVAYDLDRLHRSPRELEHFFETCDKAGVTRMATCAGDVDLATSDGRLMARIMGAVARKSSDDTSRRLKTKFDELAEAGKPHGGGRPFGYQQDRVSVDPTEAAILRELAARVLAGESLVSVTRWLNTSHIPCPQRAREWSASVVRGLLANPRQAGLRVHRGEVVGEAAWEAVIDRRTHEKLVAMLTDPGRRRDQPSRRSLLTGLCRCGYCGQPMARDTSPRGTRIIRCKSRPGYPDACGRVSIVAADLEELVTEAVLLRLDTPALARALAGAGEDGDDDGAEAELAAATERLDEVVDMFANGEIDRRGFMRARSKLEARQQTARAALSRRRRTTALDAYADQPGALRAAWPSLNLDQRRAILAAVVDRVTIGPAVRGRNTFDPSRVDVGWRV